MTCGVTDDPTPAARCAYRAAGARRLEVGIDGAPLCAHVGGALAALYRPAASRAGLGVSGKVQVSKT